MIFKAIVSVQFLFEVEGDSLPEARARFTREIREVDLTKGKPNAFQIIDFIPKEPDQE